MADHVKGTPETFNKGDDVSNVVAALAAENERLHEKLKAHHDRYWEGRWRDEKAENERLRAALIERDGGTHDSDCKSLQPWRDTPACTCGHDAVVAALAAQED